MKKTMETPILIRKAVAADVPFIFSNWLKSYRDSNFAHCISTTVYFTEHHRVVERLLKSCDVYVACNEKDTSELYGFICAQQLEGILVIHFTYVKHIYRMLGIGTMLLNSLNHDASKASMYTHHTRPCKVLAPKFRLVHSPYLAMTADYQTEQLASPKKAETKIYEGADDK